MKNRFRNGWKKKNQMGNEDGNICNLMDYFHGTESIKEKVESAIVSVKTWMAPYMAVPRLH